MKHASTTSILLRAKPHRMDHLNPTFRVGSPVLRVDVIRPLLHYCVLSATTLFIALQAFRAESRLTSSLRDAAAGVFFIGVGISDRIFERQADWQSAPR